MVIYKKHAAILASIKKTPQFRHFKGNFDSTFLHFHLRAVAELNLLDSNINSTSINKILTNIKQLIFHALLFSVNSFRVSIKFSESGLPDELSEAATRGVL